MSVRHEVAAGEGISEIAEQYGFSPATLWDFPENRQLKEARQFMDVLMPGDVVVIPELRTKQENAAICKRHVFRRKGVPARLRVRLLVNGVPRAHVAFRLEIEKKLPITGKTDEDGWIQTWVPPKADKAVLILDETQEQYILRIGYLNPTSTDSGLRSRLVNLGLLPENASDEDDMEDAISDFQASQGIPITGKMDETTRHLLLTQYGC